MRLLVASVAIALLALACAKQEEKAAPAGDEPNLHAISVEEAARGVTACQTWVDRLCACAEADATHAAACDEARAIPRAFQLSVRTANAKSLEADVRARLQREARRIVARCIEQTAQLPCAAAP